MPYFLAPQRVAQQLFAAREFARTSPCSRERAACNRGDQGEERDQQDAGDQEVTPPQNRLLIGLSTWKYLFLRVIRKMDRFLVIKIFKIFFVFFLKRVLRKNIFLIYLWLWIFKIESRFQNESVIFQSVFKEIILTKFWKLSQVSNSNFFWF